MIRLQSKANSFILNEKEFQKGALTVTHDDDGISINGMYSPINKVECDGVVFTSKSELKLWISENLFKNGGGGTGEGVPQNNSATYEGIVPLDSAELELLYPDVPNRFLVVAPNVGSGMLYIKLSMPLMDAWYSWAASPALEE